MIIAILLVLIIFSLLVFVHEFGHFSAARRSGVEVEEFGFGFPPRLVGKKVGQTIYSINWLPLGGFVRLKGEDGVDKSKGSFGAAPYYKKAWILVAGVLMNVLAAYVILVYLCFTGMPAAAARSLSGASVAREAAPNVMLLSIGADSPAARAGITAGDSIVKINGEQITNEQELMLTTKKLAGTKTTIVIRHKGSEKVVDVVLRSPEEGKKLGYLGASPFETHNVAYGRRSPLVAAQMTLAMMVGTLKGFALGIAGLLHIGPSTKGAAATVTGPVGIVALLQNVLKLGASYVLFFVATISASLAVINILPIPALDGGRLFFLSVERITGKALSPQKEALIHTVGFVLLIGFMIIITFFDIRRLLG